MNMELSILSATQWGFIFTLLSMDVISPLYEAMGLQLQQKQQFIQLLRRLVLENRRIYEANPTVVPPLAERVLEEMAVFLDRTETEHFYNWAVNVFIWVPADQPHWTAWETLFLRYAYNDGARDQLGLPLERRDVILAEYRRAVNIEDVEELVRQLKNQPLSDWDLEMYAIHNFNNNDDLSDPFANVLRTVELNRFQLFWEQLHRKLSTGEMMRLWEHGQRMAEEMGLWLPEPLKTPHELRRML
jgi:hypothetical protein